MQNIGPTFWEFSSGILILTSTLAYIEEQILHKGPWGPQSGGPVAIAIFSTIVNPALDIWVHVYDCIYSGIQVSLLNKNSRSYSTVFISLRWVW